MKENQHADELTDLKLRLPHIEGPAADLAKRVREEMRRAIVTENQHTATAARTLACRNAERADMLLKENTSLAADNAILRARCDTLARDCMILAVSVLVLICFILAGVIVAVGRMVR